MSTVTDTLGAENSQPRGRFFPACVGAIFLLAAASKVWNAHALERVLMYFKVDAAVGARGLHVAAASIAMWESLLGFLLIFVASRFARLAGVLTVVLFSLVLTVILVDHEAPGCGCFGAIKTTAHSEAILGLTRNVCLLGLLGWSARKRRATTPTRDDTPGVTTAGSISEHTRQPTGFSLIEVLVCLTVISLLVGLAAPSYFNARQRAKETRSLNTQRGVVSALFLYAKDHGDALPFMGAPGAPSAPIVVSGFVLPRPEGFFRDQTWHWMSLLVPNYFDAPRGEVESPGVAAMLRDDLSYPAHIIRSHFFLTYTAFAAPEYWATGVTTIDPALFRATRLDEITFPSQKGLVLDIGIGFLANDRRGGQACFAGVADGSARSFQWTGVDWSRVVHPPLVPQGEPVMSTRNGLRGIDF